VRYAELTAAIEMRKLLRMDDPHFFWAQFDVAVDGVSDHFHV